MTQIKEIIAYICKEYPHKLELSKARLTKLIFLADWKSSINREKQITDIKWIYNHYGPYVDDITRIAQTENIFIVETTKNMYGHNKEIVKLKNDNYEPDLTNKEKLILDSIIDISKGLYWNQFLELVYATFPIVNSKKYDELDLVALSLKYKEFKKESISTNS